MTDRAISDAGDFRNLVVYRRDELMGPVYSVVFDNPEFATTFLENLGRVAVLGAAFFVSLFLGLGFLLQAEGLGGWVILILLLIAFGFFWVLDWSERPLTVRRTIELDMGNDRLRVLKNGRPEVERQLKRMGPLTVTDHPYAEARRAERQERGEKKLSKEEKQHCLMGYFGAGAAEEVQLVSRVEWPSGHSLRQVRAAVLWARDKARSDTGVAGDVPRTEDRGINPPLD